MKLKELINQLIGLRYTGFFIDPYKKGSYTILASHETIIPRTDDEFNKKQIIIAEHINMSSAKWNLDRKWIDEVFNPARDRWDKAWAKAQDPQQRTRLITFEKNQARKNYEPLLRVIVRNLEANTLVSDEDRAEMGIFPAKPRKPSDNPTTFPDIYVNTSTIREIIIEFRDHEKDSWAKPAGVHGAEIKWGILDHKPNEVDELTHSEFDTRSPYTLIFKESERGRTIWICMRWENTRGVKGPWSEFVSAIIP
jgi:hypothetical protein